MGLWRYAGARVRCSFRCTHHMWSTKESLALSRIDTRQRCRIRTGVARSSNKNEKTVLSELLSVHGAVRHFGLFPHPPPPRLSPHLHCCHPCPRSFSSAMQLLFNHYRTTPPEASLCLHDPYGRDGMGCKVIGE